MGVMVGGEWHEELADPGGGSYDSPESYNQASGQTSWGENLNTVAGGSSGGDAMSQVNPQAIGQNEYGDDIFNTPNGQKTGTQITQELAAVGWDGVGNPVDVYNRTASGGQSPTPAAVKAVTAATKTGTGAQQYGSAIDRLYEAIISGNAQRIAEEIRQFNQTFGLDTRKFEEDVRQFNQTFGITEAGLTGTYGGQPTLPAMTSYANQFGQWGVPTAGQATLAAQQQAYAQQLGAITTAAGLQANPFRQQQVIGQLGGLFGGQGVAGFAAPNTVAGVGTAGGNTRGGMGYLQQLIDDIRDPSANTAGMNSILDATPTPTKLNSTEFLHAAPSTQSMVLQAMQEKYGLDPKDSLQQIQNTLPQAFAAPTTMGGLKR
jgi:hypothetical protein